jgi:hypothetical protein
MMSMIRDKIAFSFRSMDACERSIRCSFVFDDGARKAALVMLAAAIASGCALPSVVQRQTVEYNTAAAAMANQLALMNIIRAEQHLPIFYTSISRLSGSTVVTATGGFNAAFKTASPVETDSVSNAPATTIGSTTTTPPTAPAGVASSVAAVNSVTTTMTNLTSRAVTSGGNLYTPSIGGQVVSGPSFDINILDTQQFYQGILAEIPFSTVELLINQGFEDQLLMRLLVERIEYWRSDTGSLDHVVHNVASGDEARAFVNFISCVKLSGAAQKKPVPIAPISRVTVASDGTSKPLSLKDLMGLDGQKFELAERNGDKFKRDAYIDSTIGRDKEIYLARPPEAKRLARLDALKTCVLSQPLEFNNQHQLVANELNSVTADSFFTIDSSRPIDSPQSAATITFAVKPDAQKAPAGTALDAVIYFRSPEGLIRFIGSYLAHLKTDPASVYAFGNGPLFSVADHRSSSALVWTSVSGKNYSIASDSNAETNMTTLAIIEELVNLQKSATDRPVTVPVRVLQ